jgi:hypothetical protein
MTTRTAIAAIAKQPAPAPGSCHFGGALGHLATDRAAGRGGPALNLGLGAGTRTTRTCSLGRWPATNRPRGTGWAQAVKAGRGRVGQGGMMRDGHEVCLLVVRPPEPCPLAGALCEAGQGQIPSRLLALPGRPGRLGLARSPHLPAGCGRLLGRFCPEPGTVDPHPARWTGQEREAPSLRGHSDATDRGPGIALQRTERPARERKAVAGPAGLDDLQLLGPATGDQDSLAGGELADVLASTRCLVLVVTLARPVQRPYSTLSTASATWSATVRRGTVASRRCRRRPGAGGSWRHPCRPGR